MIILKRYLNILEIKRIYGIELNGYFVLKVIYNFIIRIESFFCSYI